jgi:hypothetical protein
VVAPGRHVQRGARGRSLAVPARGRRRALPVAVHDRSPASPPARTR